MRWNNFSIWRGKLPHWRADDVTYYVVFRHRRDLAESERRLLLRCLLKPDGRQLDLSVLCVMPNQTELMFTVNMGPGGVPFELSDVIEKAKTKAGKLIIKQSGERFPPFYNESFDRIIRDEGELEEKWNEIVESPVKAEYAEDPEDYEFLWVPNNPN